MRIDQLEALASDMIGDGQTPDVFFVTREGNVILVTTDFDLAYDQWRQLPRTRESSLENRTWGCICTVEPKSDTSKRLIVIDDSAGFRRAA